MSGRLSIVHELGGPSSAGCAGAVRFCAAVHGRRLQAPTGLCVAYGHITAVGTIRACWRLLCGRGRIVSPIDVHERRPAQLADVACVHDVNAYP
jgi:hypothetical protein